MGRSRRSRASGRVTPRQPESKRQAIERLVRDMSDGREAADEAGGAIGQPGPVDYVETLIGFVEAREGLDRMIAGTVRSARACGTSWGQLGKALSVTGQAVQQRYGASPGGTTP